MVKKTVLQTYSFREGLRDGLPIALGYLTVAFGFGLTAVQAGLFPVPPEPEREDADAPKEMPA